MEYRLPPKGLLASSRHELVVGVAALFVAGGIGGLVPPLRPPSVVEVVPHLYAVVIWPLCLLIGGVLILGSVGWTDRKTALLIEWPGFLLVGAGALVYGAAILTRWEGGFWLAETTYLILGASCIWRTARVIKKVRKSSA